MEKIIKVFSLLFQDLNGNFILVGPKKSDKNTLLSVLFDILLKKGQCLIDDFLEDPVKIININGNIFVDLDGFDINDERFDEPTIIRVTNKIKDNLIGKNFKFLFCVMFDGLDHTSEDFEHAAEQFCRIFGHEGVQSMVLVVLQDSRNHVTTILRETKGYACFKNKNLNVDVPFVIWDNSLLDFLFHKNLTIKVGQVKEWLFSSEKFEQLTSRIDNIDNMMSNETKNEDNSNCASFQAENDRNNNELNLKNFINYCF